MPTGNVVIMPMRPNWWRLTKGQMMKLADWLKWPTWPKAITLKVSVTTFSVTFGKQAL